MPGNRVLVSGREETYVVLHVDDARATADLLLMDRVRKIEDGVPLDKLKPLKSVP
jgi:hypothetical protein